MRSCSSSLTLMDSSNEQTLLRHVRIDLPSGVEDSEKARASGINFRYSDAADRLSLDEKVTTTDVIVIVGVLPANWDARRRTGSVRAAEGRRPALRPRPASLSAAPLRF